MFASMTYLPLHKAARKAIKNTKNKMNDSKLERDFNTFKMTDVSAKTMTPEMLAASNEMV